jgi:hypothetical protein
MEHFRWWAAVQAWADKPMHHVSNGGPAQSIADFFRRRAPARTFRRKIEWYRASFGDQPMVWLGVVERDQRRPRRRLLAWTAAMLPNCAAPFRNLMVQPGQLDTAKKREAYRRHSLMPGNDLAQVHRYLDLGASLDVRKGRWMPRRRAVRELISRTQAPCPARRIRRGEPRHTAPAFYRRTVKARLCTTSSSRPSPVSPVAVRSGTGTLRPPTTSGQYGRFAEAVRGIDPREESWSRS